MPTLLGMYDALEEKIHKGNNIPIAKSTTTTSQQLNCDKSDKQKSVINISPNVQRILSHLCDQQTTKTTTTKLHTKDRENFRGSTKLNYLLQVPRPVSMSSIASSVSSSVSSSSTASSSSVASSLLPRHNNNNNNNGLVNTLGVKNNNCVNCSDTSAGNAYLASVESLNDDEEDIINVMEDEDSDCDHAKSVRKQNRKNKEKKQLNNDGCIKGKLIFF